MYAGCIINNIIETITESNNINTIYSPHYSFFDTIFAECNINLFTEPNVDRFIKSEKIYSSQNNLFIKEYSAYIMNNLIAITKNNSSLNYHINSIIFEHSIDVLKLKKEDQHILCSSGLKKNNFIIFFNRIMDKWLCGNCLPISINYSIPDSLNIKNNIENRNKICFLSLNKVINNITQAYPDVDIITEMPNSISHLSEILNKYKLVIELDPGSVINCLAAIGCGCMSIVLDTNNILNQYNEIENLFIVSSVENLHTKIKQIMEMTYNTDTPKFNTYRNFDTFEKYIKNILITNKTKGFIL